jgi:hypothetical protein
VISWFQSVLSQMLLVPLRRGAWVVAFCLLWALDTRPDGLGAVQVESS